MIQTADCTFIGKITKTHGIDGSVVLRYNQGIPEEILKMESVFIMFDKQLVPFFLINAELANPETAMLKFEDYDTPDRAERFRDKEVYALSSMITAAIPPPSLEQLTGFTAFDHEHGKIGIIKGVLDIRMNPLAEIAGKDVLIPLNDDFISNIDWEEKKITFKLPEGLIDLSA